MLKKRTVHGLVICGLFLLILGLAPGCGKPAASDAWNYPTRPGTEEWNKLTSLGEMIAVCQVPEDVLAKMSTKGLVETAINYPLIGNIIFFNDKQGAINDILKQSNAIQALLQRPDAGTEMLARYRTMETSPSTEGWTDYDRHFYPLKFTGIEFFMVQEQILAQYTPEQRTEIIEIAKATFQAKKKSPLFVQDMLPDTSNLLVIKLQQYGQ
jgi:hypothetical protein